MARRFAAGAAEEQGKGRQFGNGRDGWDGCLTWIWSPVFRHCVGGGSLATCLPPLCGRREPCDLYPGVGHNTHPASLQAGVRPTSYCPCPLSPKTLRLGRLSPRHGTWSRRRRAPNGGVSSPLSPLSLFQPAVPRPAPRRARATRLSPACSACPGGAGPRYTLLHAIARVAASPRSRRHRRDGTMPSVADSSGRRRLPSE